MKDHLWKPGQSGNPKGRPKEVNTFGSLIRNKKGHVEELFRTLEELRQSKDETVRLKATIAQIEFGWGKAPQAVTGIDGGPLEITLVKTWD